ncbi:MAG: endonuclease domain-containing protein [Rhodospirillaceae bacterium]|nr:MAG: endonuclease domain-containing protein [Rhodospirillaceae bacterium]
MSNSRARSLRRTTEAEKLMWRKLRNRQLQGCKFCRQMEIGPYIADLVCREQKLIIEIDGGQHAGSDADQVRTAYLEAEGYRMLRFWNNDVLANIDGVLEALRSSLSCPSPQRGATAEEWKPSC